MYLPPLFKTSNPDPLGPFLSGSRSWARSLASFPFSRPLQQEMLASSYQGNQCMYLTRRWYSVAVKDRALADNCWKGPDRAHPCSSASGTSPSRSRRSSLEHPSWRSFAGVQGGLIEYRYVQFVLAQEYKLEVGWQWPLKDANWFSTCHVKPLLEADRHQRKARNFT